MPHGLGRILFLNLAMLLGAPSAHSAQILLIDDSPGAGARAAKSVDVRGGGREGASSVVEFQIDLESFGHNVLVESPNSDPAGWPSSDCMIWSSGNHALPLGNPAWRASLRHFVLDGGRLLIEGGDTAFHWIQGDPLFAGQVLHSTLWLDDPDTRLSVHNTQHALVNYPNDLPLLIDFSSESYLDADAVSTAPDAAMLLRWAGGIPMAAGLVAYDPDPAPSGGQIVYLPLRYSALDPDDRPLLLENAITWLLTDEPGDAALGGSVHLVGGSDDGGVKLRVQPGGQWTLSSPDGSFFLGELHGDQSYTLEASMEGFDTFSAVFNLEPGEILDDLYISLDPILQETFCREPFLSIPDDDPLGVFDSIDVGMGAFVGEVEVFLDISHSWIGDLIVELESPSGTTRLLHLRGGSNLDEIYGWYPAELNPVQDLSAFADELTDGAWIIRVADLAGADLGVLNAWCLRLSAHDGTASPEIASESRVDLLSNWPNPFNPTTLISFRLREESRVAIEVLDASGRSVRRLFSNPLPAGTHQMQWDGLDDQGHPLPSGLYLLRLEAEGWIRSHKLMLLK